VATKIVIVDDDRATLAVIEKALILDGFWAFSAKDGEEGLELVKREKPDILISDITAVRNMKFNYPIT